MTTTAHEDQFATGTQTIERIRAPYDPIAILKRNVADLELALKQQTELKEKAEEKLTTAREDMQSWIDSRNGWMERAGAAEAELEAVREDNHSMMLEINGLREELAKLREQAPAGWVDADGDFYHGRNYPNVFPTAVPVYAAPVPVPHKGATHCDDCGLTWLDDGLNPLRCPYCKDTVPALAVPEDWRNIIIEMVEWWDDQHMTLAQGRAIWNKARALLQSAEVTK